MRGDRAVVDDDAARRASDRRDPSRGPGKRASACTIQNSVSVRSTRRPAQCAVRRFRSSVSGPRSSTSSVDCGAREQVAAAEQRRDARGEVRQADVLGQVVVGAQAQAGDDVEIAVARGEEDDRQRRRQRAQFAAQREAAVDLVAQADVDDREVGQARAKRGERSRAIRRRRRPRSPVAQRRPRSCRGSRVRLRRWRCGGSWLPGSDYSAAAAAIGERGGICHFVAMIVRRGAIFPACGGPDSRA